LVVQVGLVGLKGRLVSHWKVPSADREKIQVFECLSSASVTF
jgi:hypothetical protein